MDLSTKKVEKMTEKGSSAETADENQSPLTINNTALNLMDPRLRKAALPPPPRISSNIMDKIKILENHSNPPKCIDINGRKPSSSVVKDVKENGRFGTMDKTPPPPPPPSASSPVCFKTVEAKVQQRQQPATKPHAVQNGCSTNSPFENDEKGRKACDDLTDTKSCKRQTTNKEVVEFVSSELKTREDSLEKYKSRFRELRMHYDQKKAELLAAHEDLKELRKKFQVLSKNSSRSPTEENCCSENQQLQENVKSLQLEIAKLKEEKEGAILKAEELSATLNYTRVAAKGQKILYDMQTAKLANLEKENLELKQMCQQGAIKKLKQRIRNLENAMREDVHDKNMVVSAFNLFMANTQKRVVDLFEEKPMIKDSPKRAESWDLSSSHETVNRQLTAPASKPNRNDIAANVNNQHLPPNGASTTSVGCIKTEKLSPQKRKEIEQVNDDDNNSDIVILSPPTNSLLPQNNDDDKCKKKQRSD